MRVMDPRIEVFVCSNTPTNPYRTGDSGVLPESGGYCEAVVLAREELHVPDARQSSRWHANPDMAHGLLSYLGFPIILPDGRLFGTVCVLDRQPRHYTGPQRRLLANVAKLIVGQLSMVPRDWDPQGDQDGISAGARTVMEMRVIERTQQLRRSTELLQAVMDGATDAIFLKDTSGTFLHLQQGGGHLHRPPRLGCRRQEDRRCLSRRNQPPDPRARAAGHPHRRRDHGGRNHRRQWPGAAPS